MTKTVGDQASFIATLGYSWARLGLELSFAIQDVVEDKVLKGGGAENVLEGGIKIELRASGAQKGGKVVCLAVEESVLNCFWQVAGLAQSVGVFVDLMQIVIEAASTDSKPRHQGFACAICAGVFDLLGDHGLQAAVSRAGGAGAVVCLPALQRVVVDQRILVPKLMLNVEITVRTFGAGREIFGDFVCDFVPFDAHMSRDPGNGGGGDEPVQVDQEAGHGGGAAGGALGLQ